MRDTNSTSGQGTRRSRRRALLLEHIVEAAGVVFAERGLAGATLQDVADALGVSRAALYYHVRSREELLRLVVDGYIALNQTWLREVRERADLTPEQRLRGALRVLTRGFETHPHLSRIFLREETDMPADVRDEQRAARRVIQREMEQILRDGIEAGRFAPVDPELTAFAIFGMVNWMHVWFSPGGRMSAEAVADAYADLVLGGIALGGAAAAPATALQSALEIHQLAARLAEQLANGDAARPQRQARGDDGRA